MTPAHPCLSALPRVLPGATNSQRLRSLGLYSTRPHNAADPMPAEAELER